jgi:hypothetical protein
MEKIDQILESLYDRVIEPIEAKEQLLDLFAVMPSLQQDDSDMLFHECPNCNWRCNCNDQPCSCCNEA